MPTREPTLRLVYLGVDITSDVRPFVLNASLTDNLEGKADDLAITLENRDLRWLSQWIPGEGDRVEFRMGYNDIVPDLTPAMQFEVDEPEWSGTPDLLKLSGVAVPVTASLREIRSVAYEGVTLADIAQQIADRHGLELVGDVPAISFKRISQKEQTDLEFLRKLAADYGVVFKVESASRLVFFRLESLEQDEPILAIARSPSTQANIAAQNTESGDLYYASTYRIRRKAAGTYKAASIRYQDAETGDFIEYVVDVDGGEVPQPEDGEEGAISSESILRIRERVENVEQARVRAIEALKRANRARVQASITLEGETLLSAGITITLTGWRRLDGKYLIEKVVHRLTRTQGYRCSVEAYKVEGTE
ncbi:MAG: contractile injection system protein, VgrG/Pvc8 family [Cyanobacteria bacterium J06635_1]